jgi:hypothetical protein
MKTIIAGSRSFSDYELLRSVCDEYEIMEIVSGTARGADLLGEQYGKEKGIPIKQFPADWNKWGKRAGFLRNVQMAEYGERLIAFWDGESSGTWMMIDEARKRKLEVRVVEIK